MSFYAFACFARPCVQVLGTEASKLSTKLLEDPHMVVKFVAFLVARGVVATTLAKHVSHIRKVLVWRGSLGISMQDHSHITAVIQWVDVLHKQCHNLVTPSPTHHVRSNLPSAKEVVHWQIKVLDHSCLLLAEDIYNKGTLHRRSTALATQDAAMLALCFGFLPPLRLSCVRTCLHPDAVLELGGCIHEECRCERCKTSDVGHCMLCMPCAKPWTCPTLLQMV